MLLELLSGPSDPQLSHVSNVLSVHEYGVNTDSLVFVPSCVLVSTLLVLLSLGYLSSPKGAAAACMSCGRALAALPQSTLHVLQINLAILARWTHRVQAQSAETEVDLESGLVSLPKSSFSSPASGSSEHKGSTEHFCISDEEDVEMGASKDAWSEDQGGPDFWNTVFQLSPPSEGFGGTSSSVGTTSSSLPLLRSTPVHATAGDMHVSQGAPKALRSVRLPQALIRESASMHKHANSFDALNFEVVEDSCETFAKLHFEVVDDSATLQNSISVKSARDCAKHSLFVSPVGPPPASVIPVPFNLGAGRVVSAGALLHVPPGLTVPFSPFESARVAAPPAGVVWSTPTDSASVATLARGSVPAQTSSLLSSACSNSSSDVEPNDSASQGGSTSTSGWTDLELINSQRAALHAKQIAKLVGNGAANLDHGSTQAPGEVALRTLHAGPPSVGSSLAGGGHARIASAAARAPIVGLVAPVDYVIQAGARVPVYASQLQQDRRPPSSNSRPPVDDWSITSRPPVDRPSTAKILGTPKKHLRTLQEHLRTLEEHLRTLKDH